MVFYILEESDASQTVKSASQHVPDDKGIQTNRSAPLENDYGSLGWFFPCRSRMSRICPVLPVCRLPGPHNRILLGNMDLLSLLW
eukprot:12917955-Prorocentrum_lima.AAC.1